MRALHFEIHYFYILSFHDLDPGIDGDKKIFSQLFSLGFIFVALHILF